MSLEEIKTPAVVEEDKKESPTPTTPEENPINIRLIELQKAFDTANELMRTSGNLVNEKELEYNDAKDVHLKRTKATLLAQNELLVFKMNVLSQQNVSLQQNNQSLVQKIQEANKA